MATTENSYVAPATYTIDFLYMERTDVKVTVNNVLKKQGTSEDYTFTDATTIAFNTGKEPAAGDTVRLYRDTDTSAAKATYYPGSAIRSVDLNDNNEQVLFSVQEIENHSLNRYGENKIAGDIDVDGNRLKNLKDEYTSTTDPNAADNNDAASHGWVRKFFFDVKAETQTGAEYDEAKNNDTGTEWPNNDVTIATTSAVTKFVDDRNDALLTNDIFEADGIKITDNSPATGQITIGLNDNAVDFSKIKDADIVDKSEQTADNTTQNAGNASAYVNDDTKLATIAALVARHDNIVSSTTPSGTDYQIGKFWWDEQGDKTLSVWDGSNWAAITSGGTFLNQPRLIWVDAANGNDAFDGHRVINPMRTIKAAVNSADDGDMVFVQPGVYQEALPIDLGPKKNVSVIGLSMRSCFVHPTAATEQSDMFKMGSGSFVANFTLAGLKSGTGARGGYTIDSDSTYGLPAGQAWYFAFSSNGPGNAAINYTKSPYVQNVTAFADSATNNNSFDPNGLNVPGFAGDTTSGPTGGGMLVDGSVPASTSPLRSMLSDAFTLICLDGPGVLVTNGGYAQLVSTFGTFAHYHAKALNGGQINMSNCTTDFGRYGLIADGKSQQLFTANTNALASAGDNVIVVGASSNAWRAQSNPNPADHMVCEVTYSDSTKEIIAIDNVVVTSGTEKTVTLATPSTTGIPKNILSGTTIRFYLRSQITTGGHVFEFCGSGTNYLAHPDNGGQPVEANQVKDLNDGKVYISSTDHNGKFKVGDVFTVDTDSEEARYNGNPLAASATTDTTNAANISSGVLPDARLSDVATAGTSIHPASMTIDAKGRVTSVTAGTALEGCTYEAVDDGDNAKLQLKENGTLVDEIKLVPGTGQSIDVDNAGQITLSSPNSTTAEVEISSSPPSGKSPGAMWWDKETGDSYIYYNDGNSSQWVQFAPQQTGTGNGTVTQVVAGTGLSGGTISTTGTINLANTSVTAGSYGDAKKSVSITVDAQGRLTAASEQDIDLDASDVTTGEFALARIPTLTDAKLPVSISASKIPNLDAAKITTGTFDAARIPDLSASYLTDVVNDLTPQLGGNLDVNAKDIVTSSNGNINLNPNGSGEIVSKNGQGFTWGRSTFAYQFLPPDSGSSWTLKLPTSVGSSNQYLKTNGSDQLSWDTETTYDLTGTDDSGDFRIRLAGTDSTNDDVKIKAGSGISLTNSAGETTIASTVSSIPTGTIQWYAGSTAPSGWLMCDGRGYFATDKPALYAVISTNFGVGLYSGTFRVPDLRGQFIRGLDNMGTIRGAANVDPNRGLNDPQDDQVKQHSHSGTFHTGVSGNQDVPSGMIVASAAKNFSTGGVGNYPASVTDADETRPKNIALYAIIKE